MNSKLENVIHATFLTRAALVSLLIVGSAFAATPDSDVTSETVKFQGVNVQSEAGVKELYRRIHAAARRVCDPPENAGLSSAYAIQRCEGEAEERAITKVNLPALAAYYAQKTGRPVPMLAKGQ
jgi:UrcA family protein